MIFRKPDTLYKILKLLPVPMMVLAVAFLSVAQYRKSELPPPPPVPEYIEDTEIPDSVILTSPVQTTLPQNYADYVGREYAADLSTPSNIKTEAVYDPTTGMYVIHTKLGDKDIITPYMMTAREYNDVLTRREMFDHFQKKIPRYLRIRRSLRSTYSI